MRRRRVVAALGRRAVVDRRRAGPAPDEQAAGVRGVVARHAVDYGGRPLGRPRQPPGARGTLRPERRPVPCPPSSPPDRRSPRAPRPHAPGEAAARRDLRDQIARLERELALELTAAFPRREPLRTGRAASARGGPRLLSLGELERVRDELADRVAALRDERPRERLEQMLAAPARHRWAHDHQRGARRAGLHRLGGAPAARPDRHADGVVAREDLVRLPVTRVTA